MRHNLFEEQNDAEQHPQFQLLISRIAKLEYLFFLLEPYSKKGKIDFNKKFTRILAPSVSGSISILLFILAMRLVTAHEKQSSIRLLSIVFTAIIIILIFTTASLLVFYKGASKWPKNPEHTELLSVHNQFHYELLIFTRRLPQEDFLKLRHPKEYKLVARIRNINMNTDINEIFILLKQLENFYLAHWDSFMKTPWILSEFHYEKMALNEQDRAEYNYHIGVFRQNNKLHNEEKSDFELITDRGEDDNSEEDRNSKGKEEKFLLSSIDENSSDELTFNPDSLGV